MAVHLRRLHAADDLSEASRLFDLYRQFYEQPSNVAVAHRFLADRLAREESVIFLAEIGGRALGFMQLYPTFCSIAAAPIWTLNDLFVMPEARGQGLAAAMLDEAKRLGALSGAAYLQLSTAHTNKTAQRVYEANGWKLDTVYRAYTVDV